ncbi:PREDICTED: ADM isoform X3 [Colobus angolensis palliatus]|uniref:Pro-adrenomedullin n=1 Tax=Colobus angolensis palliatus TaxID=336983 RepID=A0A2K5J807_COLAP|nr:PREDICTED: ADM isoform X3 [Colobus angolensis palliatus]XP_011803015.1 PREDICTED: ADM isoform X3 [Colobus angolensis palliatus]XP_011803016.1 PREDICTED: ADM isoform X3 [Colobus angolensis palliatus]
MKLVSVTLMYLGSLAFLGADTARLDVASQFRKKWNKWALSRGKRELRMPSSYPTGLADVKAGPAQTLIRPQDMKGTSRSPEDSSPDAARIRVKRYRQSMNNFQGLRSFGCRFGTCTVQKLAHQIYQFTDKDKDNVAPRSKISPQGYGRRRRRSLPEAGPGRTLMSSKPQAPGAPVPPSGSAPHFL